jgi:CheY-like chemotaxis protein
MIKRKILVVDDEPSITRSVKLNLEISGLFEVRTENHPAAALAAAQVYKPDLIILDIMMPDMDGGEIAFQIRSDALLKNIPIIFLTAIVTKQEARNADKVQHNERFLAKPIDVDELIACIKECLK